MHYNSIQEGRAIRVLLESPKFAEDLTGNPRHKAWIAEQERQISDLPRHKEDPPPLVTGGEGVEFAAWFVGIGTIAGLAGLAVVAVYGWLCWLGVM